MEGNVTIRKTLELYPVLSSLKKPASNVSVNAEKYGNGSNEVSQRSVLLSREQNDTQHAIWKYQYYLKISREAFFFRGKMDIFVLGLWGAALTILIQELLLDKMAGVQTAPFVVALLLTMNTLFNALMAGVTGAPVLLGDLSRWKMIAAQFLLFVSLCTNISAGAGIAIIPSLLHSPTEKEVFWEMGAIGGLVGTALFSLNVGSSYVMSKMMRCCLDKMKKNENSKDLETLDEELTKAEAVFVFLMGFYRNCFEAPNSLPFLPIPVDILKILKSYLNKDKVAMMFDYSSESLSSGGCFFPSVKQLLVNDSSNIPSNNNCSIVLGNNYGSLEN